MTLRRTNAVIIGAGMIGTVHATAVRAAGGQVRGVVASTPARSARLATQWDVPVAYPDLAGVLADDAVDVIHVCTPNALHAHQAAAALRAGKHVICEKPLATSVADARMLEAAADEAGRVLAVPFVYRYHPLVREIRARAEQGEFGAWQLIHGSYLQDWMLSEQSTNWRVDADLGGRSRAFADIGSHWCDLVEWVAGVRFAEVTARLAITRPKRPVAEATTLRPAAGGKPVATEDVAAVLLRTADDVLASVTVSQVSAGRKNRLWFELDGSEASAVFDQEQPESIWLGGPESSRVVVRDPLTGSAEQQRLSVLPAGHAQGYADCFRAFIGDAYAAMAGEYVVGLPTAADGVRSAQLVDAVLRSADTLAWTPITAELPEELAA
ncbi:Gfo/Idh/MocA family oxidoreductase [Streptomyces sp. NPDC051453]|uniref:Gfo/Idh/MocA family protein n=1 Tax=Streptomyces sp. NPDC051453 TaxID=3154941 RepID=UPI0034150155